MIEGSLARRYAKALLALGQEEGNADTLGEQLDAFVAFIQRDDGQLLGVMSHPGLTPSERKAVLEALLPKLGLLPTLVSFVRLVLDKNRFIALPDMAREYGALADLAAGRVRATVTTSVAASASLKKQIAASLAAATGKQVVLELKVDPSLLGGMVAHVGSRVYDASLRTRLDSLQVALATTALG
ncbi:MAG: ATP synthase F1 subunit delta [Myxococcales bacterium]|nr:ATP synthase F1 subunit delta [Myxococcales bacterium]